MHRFVNIVALTALVITLGAGLWQDWGLFTTMKRMILSYLGFFFLGGILALAVLTVPLFENQSDEISDKPKRKR